MAVFMAYKWGFLVVINHLLTGMILQVMNRSTPWKVNEWIPNKDGPAGTCISGFKHRVILGIYVKFRKVWIYVPKIFQNITNCFGEFIVTIIWPEL